MRSAAAVRAEWGKCKSLQDSHSAQQAHQTTLHIAALRGMHVHIRYDKALAEV